MDFGILQEPADAVSGRRAAKLILQATIEPLIPSMNHFKHPAAAFLSEQISILPGIIRSLKQLIHSFQQLLK